MSCNGFIRSVIVTLGGLCLTLSVAAADEGGTEILRDLRLSGYVQAQYEHHDDSRTGIDESGAPLNLDRFLIRRGRLKVAYEHFRFARLVLETDASSEGFSLEAAEVTLLFPFDDLKVDLTLGLFRVPFGFDTPQDPSQNLWLEPSFVARTFFPGQSDVGLRLRARGGVFGLAMAVINGNPIGDDLFPGADPNPNKDLVARFGMNLGWFTVGVSGQVGKEFVPGRGEVPAETVWVDRNQDAVAQPREVTTTGAVAAIPSDNVARSRLGIDTQLNLRGSFGELRLLFELATSHREALDTGAPALDQLAWYAAVAHQFIPFLGVALRLEGLDPDLDQDDDAQYVFESALLVYPLPAMRITLAYDVVGGQADEARRREGTYVSGNVLTVRGQMAF